MCFSAEVSFGAAGLLAIIGYQTLKLARGRSQLPLAMLPSLFAIHQFLEGVLWLFLAPPIVPNQVFYSAQFLYILMAYLLVPIWLPFSVLTLETVPSRRNVMMFFLLVGIVVAFLNVDRLPGEKVVVQVVGHSLQYPVTDWVRGVPYILTVCLPFLLSSRKHVWIVGVAGFLALSITFYFYFWTFASVWCFFAAIISGGIYCVIRELNAKKINQT